MLPKELFEAKRVKGRIYPRFAGEKDYELAERIIEIFSRSKGRKYGKVVSEIKKLETAENFKRVRGFLRVMEKLCIEKACAFEVIPNTELDPLRVRMFLFERGFVTSRKERERVLDFAAKYFNTSRENIERAMFADREEELIIIDVKNITPDELIRHYNLSLLQTAMFNSLRMTFWTSSNHKEIFRRIKWFGLMYEIAEESGRNVVEITGAASIIKMTRKYGTSMAKLLPSILKADNWWVRAEIVENSRLYILEIDDRKRDLFPKMDVEVEYDSSLEEEFSWKLRALGYEVEREPEVVKAGRYAFIPDFRIRKGGKEVFVEIAGFWTPEYLEKKVRKVLETKIPLILIARSEFGNVDKLLKKWDAESKLILFSDKLPYTAILREIGRMLKGNVEVKGDVINLRELADKHGVSIKDVLKSVPENYVVAGSWAIRDEVFEELKREIESANPKKLGDVKEILRSFGVGNDVLAHLGYRVKWMGLAEDDAIIERDA